VQKRYTGLEAALLEAAKLSPNPQDIQLEFA